MSILKCFNFFGIYVIIYIRYNNKGGNMFENLLIDIGKFFLVSGLIYFIINNALRTANYKRKAFIFLSTGVVLLMGMTIAHFVYRYRSGVTIFDLHYFAFPIAVIILTLITVTFNLIKAKKYNHHFRKNINRNKNLENFLYIIYKYEDNYYLDFKNDLYSGDIVKFERNIFFHDQMINRRIEKLKLNPKRLDLIGKVKGRNKRKQYIFYCYLVELKNDTMILERFKKIDMFAIQMVKALDFHKNIILRIIIKENFEIEV